MRYHADPGRIPRVRHLIDWRVACLDPEQFPRFRDEFIHPSEFPKLYSGGPLPNRFKGFGVAMATEVDPFACCREHSRGRRTVQRQNLLAPR